MLLSELRSDAKDLVPWKRVCKSWYSLIASPRFHKAHLKMIVTSNELRIAMPTYWKIPNERLYEYNNWKVAGSSNGLVCLYRIDEKVSLILLSNPCTREVRRLPMSPFVPEHQYMGGICLSFAYDSSTDDYKVVMEIDKNNGVTLIQVLSLRSNIWKLIGDFNYKFMPNKPGILLHGALHWVVLDYSARDKSNLKIIISFDLSREEFKVIPQPNQPRYAWHSRRSTPVPGIVDNQMCLFLLNRHNNLPREIWVLRSYNVQHSWELLPKNYEMKHQVVHHMKMVEFPSPKNKRMSFFFDDNKCLSRAWRYIRAHRFVPSLVSPYAAGPSHAKNNKTSVKSWTIQVRLAFLCYYDLNNYA